MTIFGSDDSHAFMLNFLPFRESTLRRSRMLCNPHFDDFPPPRQSCQIEQRRLLLDMENRNRSWNLSLPLHLSSWEFRATQHHYFRAFSAHSKPETAHTAATLIDCLSKWTCKIKRFFREKKRGSFKFGWVSVITLEQTFQPQTNFFIRSTLESSTQGDMKKGSLKAVLGKLKQNFDTSIGDNGRIGAAIYKSMHHTPP